MIKFCLTLSSEIKLFTDLRRKRIFTEGLFYNASLFICQIKRQVKHKMSNKTQNEQRMYIQKPR